VRAALLALLLLAATAGGLPAAGAGGAGGPGLDPLPLGAPLPAPDVPLRGVDGETWTLARARGPKGTLVVFTCNHCPWVIAWERRLAALGNDARDKGLGVVAVNPNDPDVYPSDGLEGTRKRAKKLGLRFPYVVDETSAVARAFGATRTPEAFLFDADGLLVYHGAVDDSPEAPKEVQRSWLREAVQALLERSPIEPPATKVIGCLIQWRAAAPTPAP
jgi:peroxiredoxin